MEFSNITECTWMNAVISYFEWKTHYTNHINAKNEKQKFLHSNAQT